MPKAEWKLVPVEPTQEMLAAAEDARHGYASYCYRDAYREMLEAAPRANSGVEEPAMSLVAERLERMADELSSGTSGRTVEISYADIRAGATEIKQLRAELNALARLTEH